MKINIGDKVRFLNDVGGGVVVGFNTPAQAVVLQSDGFEFPVAISECVVVSGVEAKAPTHQQRSAASSQSAAVASPQIVQSASVGSDALSLFLAFVPTDHSNLEQSPLQFTLVNNCSYSFYYTISLRLSNQKMRCRHNGVIRPDEQLSLEELRHISLSEVEYLRVQLLPFKSSGEFKGHPPIDKSFHIRSVRFLRSANFIYSPIIGSHAMLLDVVNHQEAKRSSEIDVAQLEQALNGSTLGGGRSNEKPQKSEARSTPKVVEVDLHIDSLLDTTKGMNSAAMLEYQRDHIRSIIGRYRHNSGQKIIFIHGKGDGTLRATLEAELRAAGLARRYRAASFKRYGSGAIEVNM